jgi:opacity protein-like surface antigen
LRGARSWERPGKVSRMKHPHVTRAVLVLGMLCAAGASSAGIGLRVQGGYGYIRYGDYNDRIEYLNGEYFPMMSIDGTLDEFHWVPEISGGVFMPLASRFDLEIGGGFIWGTREFSIEPVGYLYEHSVRTYPFTVTLRASLPVSFMSAKPYAFAGVGAYYATLGFTYGTPAAATSFDADLSAWGFGAHGGVGLEIPLAPKASLEVGVKGRIAPIHGFEGTKTWGGGKTEDVFLAYGTDEEGNLIYEPRPVSERDAFDEGTLDMSGVTFHVGVTVLF